MMVSDHPGRPLPPRRLSWLVHWTTASADAIACSRVLGQQAAETVMTLAAHAMSSISPGLTVGSSSSSRPTLLALPGLQRQTQGRSSFHLRPRWRGSRRICWLGRHARPLDPRRSAAAMALTSVGWPSLCRSTKTFWKFRPQPPLGPRVLIHSASLRLSGYPRASHEKPFFVLSFAAAFPRGEWPLFSAC